jgi:hypothetical protein
MRERIPARGLVDLDQPPVGNRVPALARSIRRSTSRPSGPTRTRWTRASGQRSSRPSGLGNASGAARVVTTTATGTPSSRRIATRAHVPRRVQPLHVVHADDQGRGTGQGEQAAVEPEREALGSGIPSRSPRGGPQAPIAAAPVGRAPPRRKLSRNRSATAAKDSVASDSTGRAQSTRNPRSSASDRTAPHSVVLPIPSSPVRTRATGSVIPASSTRAARVSSDSRPQTA